MALCSSFQRIENGDTTLFRTTLNFNNNNKDDDDRRRRRRRRRPTTTTTTTTTTTGKYLKHEISREKAYECKLIA